MTKNELIEQLALNTRLGSQAAAKDVLDNILDIIVTTVAKGESVYLGQTFGGFETSTRAPKSGKALGVEYSVPERKVPKFKASKAFKLAVNG